MNVALDFYDTITKDPKRYKALSQALLASGGKVYILSAIAAHNERRARNDIRKSHVPSTEVVLLFYADYYEVIPAKLTKCKELHIDLLIDDRADVIKAVQAAGILGLVAA